MTGYSSYLIYAALIDTEIGDRSTHLVAFSVKKVSGRVPSFINFIFAIFFSFDQKIVRDFNFRTMEHALLRSHLKQIQDVFNQTGRRINKILEVSEVP
jgi:hypothetical protein